MANRMREAVAAKLKLEGRLSDGSSVTHHVETAEFILMEIMDFVAKDGLRFATIGGLQDVRSELDSLYGEDEEEIT